MPEETLSSFLMRSAFVSGMMQIDKISEPLFKRGFNWLLFPSVSKELLNILTNTIQYSGLDEILVNHTLTPLYQPVSGSNFKDIAGERLTKAFGNRPSAWHWALSSAEILSTPIAHCPKCFAEQVEEFGFPWFKREWQIHKMGGCLKHGCRLVSRCPCGKMGSNSSLSLSMLQGRCKYCETPFSAHSSNDIDTTYAAWLHEALQAKLPRFSWELRAFLIKESAFRLGIKRNSDNTEIGAFLGKLYDPFLVEHPYFRPEIWSKGRTAERNYTNRLVRGISSRGDRPYDRFVPHTCLFHPLSYAFPIFTDFLVYLRNVSYGMKTKNDFGVTVDMLELDKQKIDLNI